MINLLPPKEKEWLMAKKQERLALVLGIMAIVVLICFMLILYALKFYLLKHEIYQQILAETAEKKYQSDNSHLIKEQIAKHNSNMDAVVRFYTDNPSITNALKIVYAISRPEGLYFSVVAMEIDKEKKFFKARVSGTSATREALLVFKNNMEANEHVRSVYFPPASWVKAKNVEFYTTFELTP